MLWAQFGLVGGSRTQFGQMGVLMDPVCITTDCQGPDLGRWPVSETYAALQSRCAGQTQSQLASS